jgi:hypothetical protein
MGPEIVTAAEKTAYDFRSEILRRDEPVLVAAQNAIQTGLELLLPDGHCLPEGRIAPLSDRQQSIPPYE